MEFVIRYTLILCSLFFTSISTVFSQSPTCDQDYSLINDKCYKYYDIITEWMIAETYCERFTGGSLPLILTLKDQQDLETFIESNPRTKGTDTSLWLGATDLYRAGNFSWTPGNVALNFTKWEQAPKNTGSGECVTIKTSGQHTWRADSCTYHYPFVCVDRARTQVPVGRAV